MQELNVWIIPGKFTHQISDMNKAIERNVNHLLNVLKSQVCEFTRNDPSIQN